MLPSGEEVAAPSSLNSMLSQLSTAFQMLGRCGPWDEGARGGNPVDSRAVSLFRSGYRQVQYSAGFEEGSAVEWRPEEVAALVAGMDAETLAHMQAASRHMAACRASAAQSSVVSALLSDRDATLVTYLWGGAQQGKEAGALTVGDLSAADGAPLSLPMPSPLPVGYQVGCREC